MNGRAHLDRLLAAMAAAGHDALLLGHEDDVRWVTGARRLWLDGTRPFTPTCVVVRSTAAVHLVATSDAGLPAFLGAEHVLGPGWDPAAVAARVAGVPGLSAARTVATDGTDPVAEARLAALLPRARFVDGAAVVRSVRRPPDDHDRAAIATAVDVARRGLAAAVAGIVPGTSERDLAAAFLERLGRLGAVTLASAPLTCVAGPQLRTFPDDRVLAAGDLVHLRGGVLVDGHLGVVARTRVVGTATAAQEAALAAARTVLRATAQACRPGQDPGELRARPGVLAVDGVGTGFVDLADGDPLVLDDVCWIEVHVDGVRLGDVVHVGPTATTPVVPTPSGLG